MIDVLANKMHNENFKWSFEVIYYFARATKAGCFLPHKYSIYPKFYLPKLMALVICCVPDFLKFLLSVKSFCVSAPST